jgi:hypothetical protein
MELAAVHAQVDRVLAYGREHPDEFAGVAVDECGPVGEPAARGAHRRAARAG